MPTSSSNLVLLVEDEEKVQRLSAAYLEQHGFKVVVAADGAGALRRIVEQNFEIVILDLNLPGIDGLDVLRAIRQRGNVPVLVVSARAGGEDRVSALEVGADDYLTKPYYPGELVARINALLRRARLPSTQVSEVPLVFESDQRGILLYGEFIALTQKEFDLLHLLASKPGKIFSREELFERVWGDSAKKAFRRIDLYISRLRPRIQDPKGGELIVSVYGKGYQLQIETPRSP